MRWNNATLAIPEPSQRKQILQVARELLKIIEAPTATQVIKAARALMGTGYSLREYQGPEGHWLILEPLGDRRGAGYYVIRSGKLPTEIVLQAPHAIYDVHTDVITMDCFRSKPFRAAFFSDWQRYGKKGAEPIDDSPYDLAHNPDTLFQQLTELWLTTRPNTAFVQFHGFNPSSVREKGVDLIVSPGTRKDPPQAFEHLVERLTSAYPTGQLRVFPSTTHLLGGTGNVQGKFIRKAGGLFAHIEISEPMRNRLKKSSAARLKLATPIIEALCPNARLLP